jgi:hypothetical protein
MSVLRNLEAKLTDLVEGTFGRVFRSEVRPVELARKLAREMDEHKTVSVSRTYVPNEYVVYLSTEDRARLEGVEASLIEELSAYLLEHARTERLALPSRPQIEFRTDERLALGEFGIQARLVRPSEDPDVAEPEQADHGNTMIYSTAGRLREPVEELQGTRPTRAPTCHAAMPKCCPPPRARGRSPTSARRTASSSTGSGSRAPRSCSAATGSRSGPRRSRSSSTDHSRGDARLCGG